MANMSYCRFQNTVQDLRDCADRINTKLSEEESRARLVLIELCRDILIEVGIDCNVSDAPIFGDYEEEED